MGDFAGHQEAEALLDQWVISTVQRIEEALVIDGFVYRFQPGKTSGYEDVPVGEFEGAFLPCTFWLATNCFPRWSMCGPL